MALASKHACVRLSSSVSDVRDLASVPRCPAGHFYVTPLLGEWTTDARRALEANLSTFAAAIDPSVVLELDHEVASRLLRDLGAKVTGHPVLLVTMLHPSEWQSLGGDDRFMQVQIGALSGHDPTVRYLQRLATVLSALDERTGEKLSWEVRRQQVTKLVKKVPVGTLTKVARAGT